MWINVKKKWTVGKNFMIFFLEIIFPLRHVTLKRPVLRSNNSIRSQNLLISPCPRRGTDKLDVYGERQSSHDFIWI